MSTNTASSTAPRHYAVFISYRHSDNVEMGRKWANWLHEVLSAPRDDGARALRKRSEKHFLAMRFVKRELEISR